MRQFHFVSLQLLGFLLVFVPFPRQIFQVDAFAAGTSKGRKVSSSKSTGGGGGFGAASKAPTFIHTPDTSESTQQLLQFLKAQKAKGLDNVDIGFHQGTGVRGLFCTTNMKQGQIVCRIPSDCALALSDPNKNGEDAPTVAHGGANFLEMYWNNEQNKRLWSPYLDTLPKRGSEQFDPTPDFLEEDELMLLEFPRLIQRAKERKEQVEKVAAEKGISEEELKFATWLVSSRAFQLSLSAPANEKDEMPQYDDRGQVIDKAQKKTIRVMVPFIDMANHSSDQPNCKLTLIDPEKDDAWFALEATRPISAGKELVISYGSGVDSSVELLMDYGFVPSSNRIDSIMLEKGGDDAIAKLDGWTTTLDEDKTMLEMSRDDPVLQKILQFRIRLKESYKK
ncbi:SET methyltransferase domain containing protein [Nitzschia inconspicua]|uniref:SET methyltransferase domain containing protein n=1 Tax=Nitzschia inconspicua TaxID=303405 RepID=A0A9K3PQ73_9STRA|nr:SET methyltransferase domain containing protein [Nitzschia inconspicua]